MGSDGSEVGVTTILGKIGTDLTSLGGDLLHLLTDLASLCGVVLRQVLPFLLLAGLAWWFLRQKILPGKSLCGDLVALFTEVLPYLLLAGLACWFHQKHGSIGDWESSLPSEWLSYLLLAGLALWFLQQRFQRGPVFVQPAPAPVQFVQPAAAPVPVTGITYRISGEVYAPTGAPVQVEPLPTNMQAPAEGVVSEPVVVAPVVISPAKSVYVSSRSRTPSRLAQVVTPTPLS